ncbi:membrane-spanning 4-domains subfamily A member 12 [Erinaceus europaeus]|uniref:Membrane-spanning 4-domains subfamily A member 12 n=1 Tax=Erinaceus europaeus TaxID=9365 RepID=A0A1S3W6Y3_ERIEU|nr:membrane-spanning 4-domains subfamily A member 12 [Erinaceus europaeus]
MMSSRPGTSPSVYGNMPKPSQTSNSTAWRSQPPPSSINMGYQAQSGLSPPTLSPGIFINSQLGQGNIQVLNPTTATPATTFYDYAKPLGAIQIIIGLMHIAFGIVLGLICVSYASVYGFASVAFLGGYPFWGGLSFIIAGALSIAATKDFSPCLLKGSLAMTILSAIFSFIGVILFLVDESINGVVNQDYWAVLSGKGISAVLIIFCLLEFCIACTTARFSSQAVANSSAQRPVVFVSPAVNTLPTGPSYPPSTHNDYPAPAMRY